MNQLENTRSDVEVVLEHAMKHVPIELVYDAAGALLAAVVPDGKSVQSLADYRRELRKEEEADRLKDNRTGTANLLRVESLIAHIGRHSDDDTVIFCDGTGIQAIFDYNKAGGHADAPARPCKHRARWAFPLSTEWQQWQRAEGALLEQATFARLVQDRLADVIDHHDAGADILELAIRHGVMLCDRRQLVELGEGLSVRIDQSVATHVRISSGESQMVFKTEHKDEKGEPLTVPSGFLIAIPVFEGEAAYTMPVRLSYRVRSGVVKWEVALVNREEVIRDAIELACEKVKSAFPDTPFFHGTPEK